jgi:hypothetical protein
LLIDDDAGFVSFSGVFPYLGGILVCQLRGNRWAETSERREVRCGGSYNRPGYPEHLTPPGRCCLLE